jgi:hypothetical protein
MRGSGRRDFGAGLNSLVVAVAVQNLGSSPTFVDIS